MKNTKITFIYEFNKGEKNVNRYCRIYSMFMSMRYSHVIMHNTRFQLKRNFFCLINTIDDKWRASFSVTNFPPNQRVYLSSLENKQQRHAFVGNYTHKQKLDLYLNTYKSNKVQTIMYVTKCSCGCVTKYFPATSICILKSIHMKSLIFRIPN